MKLALLNFGKATNANPHNVQNAVVAGQPYSAHVGNVDHEVQDIIDRSQSHVFAIPGEVVHRATAQIPYVTSAVGHTWNNAKHVTTLLEHVPIPWLE